MEEDSRLDRLQRLSNLGPLTRLTFEGLIQSGVRPDGQSQQLFGQALEASLNYARQPEGWLVLLGPSGTGKTHLAAAIANDVMSRGEYVLFVVVPDLLDHLRSAFGPESDTAYDDLFEQVKDFPVLVLDDLGAHSATPWAQEKLFQIINHRFNRELPTVITTNVPLDRHDEALRSRLTDPALSKVTVTAVDAASDDTAGMGELPPKLRTMTFQSFDVDRPEVTPQERESLSFARQAAQGYARGPEGWLVLMGQEFCGKTHLAAAVTNELAERGERVLFVVVPELLDHLRATYMPDSPVGYDEMFERVKTAPYLVLDDLGAHSSTPWARDKLYQIINYRYNAMLPMVVTMRADLTDGELDPRLAARLGDNTLSNPMYLRVRGFYDGKPAGRVDNRPRPAGRQQRRS